MRKKICDMCVNDYDGNVWINGKIIKSYSVWRDMLRRCYDPKYQQKYPTYVDCTVCDEWLYFSKFKRWFDENYPYHLEEQGIKLNIDKDLLSNGGKVYSPDTCVFLPRDVNLFMSTRYSNNTSGHTGVCWSKLSKKWHVRINEFDSNKRNNIGYFTNIEDAKDAYLKAREIEAEKCKEYLKELGYNKIIIEKIK